MSYRYLFLPLIPPHHPPHPSPSSQCLSIPALHTMTPTLHHFSLLTIYHQNHITLHLSIFPLLLPPPTAHNSWVVQSISSVASLQIAPFGLKSTKSRRLTWAESVSHIHVLILHRVVMPPAVAKICQSGSEAA